MRSARIRSAVEPASSAGRLLLTLLLHVDSAASQPIAASRPPVDVAQPVTLEVAGSSPVTLATLNNAAPRAASQLARGCALPRAVSTERPSKNRLDSGVLVATKYILALRGRATPSLAWLAFPEVRVFAFSRSRPQLGVALRRRFLPFGSRHSA